MFRFTILAGVSSDAQVEDLGSIPDQIQTCRQAIQQFGGVEVGCYVMDGYSRTGYDSLAEAMDDIPPLAGAIKDAEQNKYDVLILDNWDRLGDLGQLVHTRFRKYRKQIYSARQSGRLHDPSTYDPYSDESAGIDMHIQGILQTYRINKMRRGWNVGVPRRIEKGLHPLSLPYGYKLTGPGQPAEILPEQAALLRCMKDWMLAGETYTEIARRADQSGLPSPRGKKWSLQVVKRILINPYYAGFVRFGKTRYRTLQPKSQWKVERGQHEPLWDEATYHALVAEAKRRLEGKRHFDGRYPFTGLTYCGVCQGKIGKHGKPPFEYLACSATHRHWAMRYEKAVAFLTVELARQLKEYHSTPPAPIDLAPLRQQLAEIQARRRRVQDGYEAGLYEAQEASVKLNALQEEAEAILNKIEKAESHQHTRQEWQERLGGLQGIAEAIPRVIQHDDPAHANQMLTAFIDKIILEGETAQFIWRE
jgi:hypothetical protein